MLQRELNAINDEQKYYEKLRVKYLHAAQNKLKEEKDFEKLQEILKQQKEQIKKITKEIQTLRLKIKPEHQFLLNERVKQDTSQILTFPGYILDVCENSPRTQSTHSFSTKGSVTSKASAESDVSPVSRASTAF